MSNIRITGAWLWSSRINGVWRLPRIDPGQDDDVPHQQSLSAWLEAPGVLPPAPHGAKNPPPLNAPYRKVARRASAMSRSVLYVHHLADAGDTPMVFASEHGELCIATTLLTQIIHGEPLSPAGFSHSVHSAAVGLAALLAKTRQATSMVSAGRATLRMGMLEASALAVEHGKCLLLVADDVAPQPLETVVCTTVHGFALAIQLVCAREGSTVFFLADMKLPSGSAGSNLEASVFQFFHGLGQTRKEASAQSKVIL